MYVKALASETVRLREAIRRGQIPKRGRRSHGLGGCLVEGPQNAISDKLAMKSIAKCAQKANLVGFYQAVKSLEKSQRERLRSKIERQAEILVGRASLIHGARDLILFKQMIDLTKADPKGTRELAAVLKNGFDIELEVLSKVMPRADVLFSIESNVVENLSGSDLESILSNFANGRSVKVLGRPRHSQEGEKTLALSDGKVMVVKHLEIRSAGRDNVVYEIRVIDKN